jgi:hypothetical protein
MSTSLTFSGTLVDVGLLRADEPQFGFVMKIADRVIEVYGLSRMELAGMVNNETPLGTNVVLQIEVPEVRR